MEEPEYNIHQGLWFSSQRHPDESSTPESDSFSGPINWLYSDSDEHIFSLSLASDDCSHSDQYLQSLLWSFESDDWKHTHRSHGDLMSTPISSIVQPAASRHPCCSQSGKTGTELSCVCPPPTPHDSHALRRNRLNPPRPRNHRSRFAGPRYLRIQSCVWGSLAACCALVDTGTRTSLISTRYLARLGLPILPQPATDLVCLFGYVFSITYMHRANCDDVYQDHWLLVGIIGGITCGLIMGLELLDIVFSVLPWSVLIALLGSLVAHSFMYSPVRGLTAADEIRNEDFPSDEKC